MYLNKIEVQEREGGYRTVIKNKVKMSLILIGIALVIGYFGFNTRIEDRVLSHNELTNYIDQYWYQGKPIDFNIELEKDVEDLHLLLLSYQQDLNPGQQTGLAVFKRLPNGKYRYVFFAHPVISTVNTAVLTTNKGASSQTHYGVIFGIIPDNQPTKYSIIVDSGKEFTDTFEKNKYFIREYDLKTQTGFSWGPI